MITIDIGRNLMITMFLVTLFVLSTQFSHAEPPSIAPTIIVDEATPNLIQNGDFEHLDDSNLPLNWNRRIEGEGYSITVEDRDGEDDSRALRLEGAGGGSGRAHVIQRGIPITEYRGKSLVLRGMYKGVDVHAASHYLNVEFLNEEQNQLIAPSAFIRPPGGTTDWMFLEQEVRVPDNAVYVWINANLLNGTGTVWWDDLELREGSVASTTPFDGMNLFQNPNFVGGEYQIPPFGWVLYGNLAQGHKLSVLHADDSERRALLIEDMVSIPRGNEGEIGLHQTVPAQGGNAYRVTALVGGAEGASSEGTNLQLRFFPSNELTQIPLTPKEGKFEEYSIQSVAPEGTTDARVYVYTLASATPKILVKSITLTKISRETMKEARQDGVINGIPPLVFDLSEGSFRLPPLDELRGRLPEDHPRLFTRPEDLQHFREKRTRSIMAGIVWRNIRDQALYASLTPMAPYPPDARPGGVLDPVAWRQGIDIANEILKDLHALSFAYLITGENQYGIAGKEKLLHVAKWDPHGMSGRAKNDEISMRLLYGLSRAYDWLYPILTPEERKLVQETMRARGNDVYVIMRRTNFEDHLLNNHLVRSLGFLGEAAIAFMGDFPEAEVWFDYVVSLFALKYPPWGGDEGGWSQGVGYWQGYVSWVLEFLDAFKIATGVDLYDKPFFRNTGYFGFYTFPPRSKFGAFGDGSDGRPSLRTAQLMSHFATTYNHPGFQWHASQISGMGSLPVLAMDDFVAYVRVPDSIDELIPPEFPKDLPQSRVFNDIGWAILNVDMEDWDNNVHIKFKSSPYGSFNHSHAEQNSFIIEAYGSPLAISSGYYPWYGSPHHREWTWESRSKNTILVDGRGQGVQSIDAKGEIITTSFGSHFDFLLGDATESYEGRLDRFWRHLWFIKPNLIVVYDQLEADGASTFDWLLHTQHQMEVDSQIQRVRVPADTAEMWVSFVAPQNLVFDLTDQFTVPPEEPHANKPNQWHLTATARAEEGRGRFLTVLEPRPNREADEEPWTVAPLDVTNGHGAEIRDARITYHVAFRDDSNETLQMDGWTTDANAWALWRNDDAHHGLMIVDGSFIQAGDREMLRSLDGPIDVSIAWNGNSDDVVELRLQLPADRTAALKVKTQFIPERVFINETELAFDSWAVTDDKEVTIWHRL